MRRRSSLNISPGLRQLTKPPGQSWQSFQANGPRLSQTPARPCRRCLPARPRPRRSTKPNAAPVSNHPATVTVRAFRYHAGLSQRHASPRLGRRLRRRRPGSPPSHSPPSASRRSPRCPPFRHEFLHALLEAHSSPNAPLWLREGLVEVLVWPNPLRNTRLHEIRSANPHNPSLPTRLSPRPAASESNPTAAHRAAAMATPPASSPATPPPGPRLARLVSSRQLHLNPDQQVSVSS